VQLQEFYWDKTNGQQVLATNLVPALANNNEWASLGNGTYTPLCLSWLVTANNIATQYYIKLSLVTYDWSEISSAELSTC
jgi:Ni/Fe-hydrogenase subunit HybB-like protein